MRAGKGASRPAGGRREGASRSHGDGVRRAAGGGGGEGVSGRRGRERPGVPRGSGRGPRSFLFSSAGDPARTGGPLGQGGGSRGPLEATAAPPVPVSPMPGAT